MKLPKFAASLLFAGVMAAPVASAAQAPEAPRPGPEHETLKMDEGTWDATIEVVPPGAPPMTSKGVETNTMGCGGKCLITDFRGDLLPGVPFLGHGVATWDPGKKKYVTCWTDSMSTGLSVGEATWDPAARRMTGWVEGPDMTGKVTKSRAVTEYKDGTRVFTAYAPGPDGKEMQALKITYTKRK